MNDVTHARSTSSPPFAQLRLDSKRIITEYCSKFGEWFPGITDEVIGSPFDRCLSRNDRAGKSDYLAKLAGYRSGFLDAFVVLHIGPHERFCRIRMQREPCRSWQVYLEALEPDDPVRFLLKARENQIAIMRSASVGTAFLDEEQRIHDYNQKFYEICDFRTKHGVALSEASIMGRTIPQISSKELAPLHAALANEIPRERNFDGRIRLGNRTLHFILSPTFLALNLVGGYVLTVEDLTDIEELTRLRLENARSLGQAEIATSMLHNVGNVLNSLTVSREMLSQQSQDESLDFLEQVIDRLASENPLEFLQTPQGQKLVPCLAAIASKLRKQSDDFCEELHQMGEHIRHIQAIISKQQRYAKKVELIERCLPDQLLDDALTIAIPNPGEAGIEVSRSCTVDSEYPLDRHRVTEILVNLLKNASEAFTPDQSDRTIQLATHLDQEQLVFSVRDSGGGIAQEHQAQLFQHGFTTKEQGHGFGLHSCGCIAIEMGAELTGTSEGLGQGSHFQLRIPV